MSDQFAHLPPLHRQILAFLGRQPDNQDGIHVAAITRGLASDKSGLNAHQIRCEIKRQRDVFADNKHVVIYSEALDRLMDEGLVFTTIDESHFKLSG
jgi:replication factor A2